MLLLGRAHVAISTQLESPKNQQFNVLRPFRKLAVIKSHLFGRILYQILKLFPPSSLPPIPSLTPSCYLMFQSGRYFLMEHRFQLRESIEFTSTIVNIVD